MIFNKTIFILFVLSGVAISSCKTGKQKIPKSKQHATATYDKSGRFYSSENKKKLKEQKKLTAQKKKELEKVQPGALNQDYDINKTRENGPPPPKTYY